MNGRIIRWNPFREMAAMQSAMDRLFEDTWRNYEPMATSLALDVHEADNAYTVVTSIPGVKADDIHITMHDGTLTITAEYNQPEVEKDTRVLVNERVYGKFTRSITLPQAIDSEKVNAQFENGVLTLTLPKLPNAQPRQIPVRTSTIAHN